MSADVCEDFVEGRPLRVTGGFPCGRPAKATVVDRGTGNRIRVCGIHARSRATWGWSVERDEPTEPEGAER